MATDLQLSIPLSTLTEEELQTSSELQKEKEAQKAQKHQNNCQTSLGILDHPHHPPHRPKEQPAP